MILKRIYVILLIVALVCSCLAILPASAASTRVEGEKYKSVNAPVTNRTGEQALSGGGATMVQTAIAPGQQIIIVLEFETPKDGYYTIEGCTTKTSATYTSPYSFKFDSGEWAVGTESLWLEDVNALSNAMAKYRFGTFRFTKGKHTMSFMVTQKRSMDNLAVFYLDYIDIIDAVWKLEKVSKQETFNVFEEGEPIIFDVKTSMPDNNEHRLDFIITDYWGSQRLEGQYVIPKGRFPAPLALGRFRKGWYEITLSERGIELLKTAFSVVPDMSKRLPLPDSPFACDAALMTLAPSNTWESYIKAMRLTGVTWVRDRMAWSNIETAKGVYDFASWDKLASLYRQNGLKLQPSVSGVPRDQRRTGGQMPDDLRSTYDFFKLAGNRYAQEIQGWEIWNEQDTTTFLGEQADYYTAFYKTAAIALSDTKNNPLKIVGGLTRAGANSIFIPQMFRNDLLKYLDIYNMHRHARSDDSVMNIPLAPINLRDPWHYNVDYNTERLPNWLNETGIAITGVNVDYTKGQAAMQANYLVTSTAESLSIGSSKHFWFVMPYYMEGVQAFGTFNRDRSPTPAITAEAVMTYVLGAGRYLGYINGLPQGATGYMFDSGAGHVALMFADGHKTVSLKARGPVTFVDIMGGESVITPDVGGMAEVSLSNSPVYVHFGGESPTENYERAYNYTSFADKTSNRPPKTFTPSERIVMLPKYEDSAHNAAKFSGYKLTEKDNPVTLEVYNFNDKPMSGTINIHPPKNWEASISSAQVTAEARGKASVEFTLRPGKDAMPDLPVELYFTGIFDGDEISRSLSYISLEANVVVPPSRVFESAKNASNWIRTISEDGETEYHNWTEGGEGAVQFKNSFPNSLGWAYPEFPVEDASDLADAAGLAFEIHSDTSVSNASVNIIVVQNNGYRYVTSPGFGFQEGGWRQYRAPWTRFRNLDNANDMTPIDPAKIVRISLGINPGSAYADFPLFAFRNIGPYTLDGGGGSSSIAVPLVNGITDGQTVEGSKISFTVEIPDGYVPESTRVVMGELDLPYTVSGNVITVNAKDIPYGRYRLIVNVYTPTGWAATQRLALTFKERSDTR